MKKLYALPALILILFLIGCHHRAETHGDSDSSIIRTGMLKIGLDKQAFMEVWGAPTRTRVESKEITTGFSLRPFRRLSLDTEQQITEIWTYEDIGIQLVFVDDKLSGWETERTVKELKSAAIPEGYTDTGKTSGGKKVYFNPNASKEIQYWIKD